MNHVAHILEVLIVFAVVIALAAVVMSIAARFLEDPR
jgi:hypothetical protein